MLPLITNWMILRLAREKKHNEQKKTRLITKMAQARANINEFYHELGQTVKIYAFHFNIEFRYQNLLYFTVFHFSFPIISYQNLISVYFFLSFLLFASQSFQDEFII